MKFSSKTFAEYYNHRKNDLNRHVTRDNFLFTELSEFKLRYLSAEFLAFFQKKIFFYGSAQISLRINKYGAKEEFRSKLCLYFLKSSTVC